MESIGSVDNDLNQDTELRLGLPGRDDEEMSFSKTYNKRTLSDQLADGESEEKKGNNSDAKNRENIDAASAPAAKSQIIGWPPVRSSRKNVFQTKKTEAGSNGMYVKVSMDGAPYLRKIDLKGYNNYPQLLKVLENMFKLKIGKYSEKEGYKGSEYAPAYEDKDGDLMLVGDVPWDMFISSCKRLRIIKGGPEAKG